MPRAFGDAGWLVSLFIVIALCAVGYITATFIIESMSVANALNKLNRAKGKLI